MRRIDVEWIVWWLFISLWIVLILGFIWWGFQPRDSIKKDSIFFVPFSFLFPVPINQSADWKVSSVCERSESPSEKNVYRDPPISEISSFFNLEECNNERGCKVYTTNNAKEYKVYYIIPKIVSSD